MHALRQWIVIVCAVAFTQGHAVASAQAGAAQGPAPDATQVLTAAREALGGEQRLSAVKTFVATGRTRQIRGNTLVPIEFEINCELPDKFVRKDEIPAQDTDPTTLGFSGEDLIQLPPPPPGRIGGPPAPANPGRAGGPPPPVTPSAPAGPGTPGGPGRAGGPPPLTPEQQQRAARLARVNTIKQDFARLTLGMFATSFKSYPLGFSYAGQAEAPQGKADVIDVKGPANFSMRLLIHTETRLPVMVSWQVPAANVILRIPGQAAPSTVPPGAVIVDAPAPPGDTASQEERDKYAKDLAALRQQSLKQAKPIEHRLYYADYRDVDGVKFPFRLRRAIAGETTEETTFDRFRINAKIDPRKFEVQQ